METQATKVDFNFQSIREAAHILGLKEFTVRRIVEAQLPEVVTVKSGSRWYVDVNSLKTAIGKGSIAV